MSTANEILTALLAAMPDSYQKTVGYPTHDLLAAAALRMEGTDEEVAAMRAALDPENLTGGDLDRYIFPRSGLERRQATFVKPRWDENAETWVEGASKEELAAWEAEHPAPMIDLDVLRTAKQEQNKKSLADWLAAHPLTWTDGNVYGVTEQDQTEMAINLAQYQLAAAAEQPAALEWHAQKQQCHTFTIDEYTALSLAIAAYVYPYRRYQEQVKAAIYAAQSKEELDAIEIDYGGVSAAA